MAHPFTINHVSNQYQVVNHRSLGWISYCNPSGDRINSNVQFQALLTVIVKISFYWMSAGLIITICSILFHYPQSSWSSGLVTFRNRTGLPYSVTYIIFTLRMIHNQLYDLQLYFWLPTIEYSPRDVIPETSYRQCLGKRNVSALRNPCRTSSKYIGNGCT